MASDDQKELYSKASRYYVENHTDSDNGYNKSLERKEKHNQNWEKQKVNLNEIIDRFSPRFEAHEHNSKMIFYGERYNVVADMASGYLRIYDKVLRTYVKLNGTPGNDNSTHFKIMKREEM